MRLAQYLIKIILIIFVYLLMFHSWVNAYTIKYYKHAVEDVNWLPVFFVEIENHDGNQKTYFKIENNDKSQIESVERYIHGEMVYRNEYYYKNNQLDEIKQFYGGELAKRVTYQWENEKFLLKEEIYNIKGDLSGYNIYHHTNNAHEMIEYSSKGIQLDSYKWWTNENNLTIKYIYFEGPKKFYLREVNPKNGLINNSKCFMDNLFLFEQRFIYDDTGVIAAIESINNYGRKYSKCIYKAGLRTEEMYQYSDGSSGKYEFIYLAKSRLLASKKLYRNNQCVAQFRYTYNDANIIAKTEIYNSRGTLISEYPFEVYYIDQNGLADDPGRKYEGNIFRRIKLW